MSVRPIILILLSCMISSGSYAADHETVLITGANRGIGLEFVKQLAAQDWRIIATARQPATADELNALAEANPMIQVEQLDVTSADEIKALAEKYTDQPIDLLLLNAAKGPSQPSATAPLSRQEFDDAALYFETNAIGPMRVAQAFMNNVRASGLKRIVAISSDSGSFVAGAQIPILYHYKASKVALNMYMRTLSFETRRRGVTLIMLHPGIVATNDQTARLPGAMPTTDSVRQMIAVITNLQTDDNGRFLDFKGETMPW